MYCDSFFERGHGLGNRLFPWARARIFASANDIPMLAPKWVSPRITRIFRKEATVLTFPGQVLLFGQLKPRTGDITGWKRQVIRWSADVHPEPSDFTARLTSDVRSVRQLIRFRGDLTGAGRFNPIEGHDQMIRSELKAITRSKWLALAERTLDIPIGIHVRLGDFRTGSTEDFRNDEGAFTGGMRTDLQWYIDGLRVIREALGSTWPAFIVSNGAPNEIKPLMEIEAVSFVQSHSPISDMWSLANCMVLMASVGSSFSAWSSYLGQMPTLLYPMPEAHSFPIKNRHGLYNGLFDPQSPDVELLRSLRAIAARPGRFRTS